MVARRAVARFWVAFGVGLSLAAWGTGTAAQDNGEAAAALPPGPATLDPHVLAQGEQVYSGTCAACHENIATHAPSKAALATLSPEAVLRIVTDGRMKEQAAGLNDEQKRAVAQAVTRKPFGITPPTPEMPRCTGTAAQFDFDEPPVFAGWGLDASNSHAIPTATAGLTRANVGKLKLKWAFAFPQVLDARSQPALAGGAIYVGGSDGTLYALDRESGCVRWTYEATRAIRNGVTVAPWQAGDTAARPLLYFGDGFGNTYALDARTGEEQWKVRTDTHPATGMTGSPTLYDNMLYVPVASVEEGTAGGADYECCTFRGSLLALDAKTGAERWRTYFVGVPKPRGPNEAGVTQYGPSGVAVWSAPLVDPLRRQVYVATGDNYSDPATPLGDALVALDMYSGTIRWATQVTEGDSWNGSCYMDPRGANCPEDEGPDFDFGAAPIMAHAGDRDLILAGQKSGIAYAFDPDTGKVVWQSRVGRGGIFGGAHFGVAAEGSRFYVPIFDQGETIDSTLPPMPGVYALDIATGAHLWAAPSPLDVCADTPLCSPGYTQAISATPELVFAGSADGHMRIFDAADGTVLWDEDTNRSYRSVNGVEGHGGSMSGSSAPLAVDGTLIFSSGYAFLGKMPGNVLLVYEAE